MIDQKLFDRLKQSQILVVGDVMLDRYLTGETHRISPEAPVPVVKVVATQDKAGGAANVARNLAHLHTQVALLGVIGNDIEGERLTQLLLEDSVKTHLVRSEKMTTITKMRVISRKQQMVRLDYEGETPISLGDEVEARFKQLAQGYPRVIFSDYGKGALNQIAKMIAIAKSQGCQVLIDPKSHDFSRYRGADIITPNLAEFRQAGGDIESEETILSSARKLLKQHQIEAIVLTRSEAGMTLITEKTQRDFPACVREVSDVTGAGDTVIALLAAMQSAGLTLSESVKNANLAAGIVVGKLGAATVSPEELSQRLEIERAAHSLERVAMEASNETALSQISEAKRRNERIVFTNGCFDLLHAGHVHYLSQARALGDRLVVGLNSDASVRRLKGKSRPVHSLQERMALLKGLRAVDWVIPFGDQPHENDTPLELILQVEPHLLVKGGDYTVEEVCGASEVQSWGGEVKILGFLEGCSTTQTIARVKEKM
jgi:D-beta-D-heptose 7-phosphate kinase/D-beta-D-heptose 1-phosphate adenosyltransferase